MFRRAGRVIHSQPPQHVMQMTSEKASILLWSGFFLTYGALLADVMTSAMAVAAFFFWVNPYGDGHYWWGVWIGSIAVGLLMVWTAFGQFFRGSGYYETKEEQQSHDLHGIYRMKTIHHDLSLGFSVLDHRVGIGGMAFMILTSATGLLTFEWPGIMHQGSFDLVRFLIAALVDFILALLIFLAEIVGTIRVWHYRDHAKQQQVRDTHAQQSVAEDLIPTSRQLGPGRAALAAQTPGPRPRLEAQREQKPVQIHATSSRQPMLPPGRQREEDAVTAQFRMMDEGRTARSKIPTKVVGGQTTAGGKTPPGDQARSPQQQQQTLASEATDDFAFEELQPNPRRG